MKNILFVHSSAELYGSDKSLLYLAQNLNKEKYKITIILPCNGPLVEKLSVLEGVEIIIFEVAILRRKNLSVRGILQYLNAFGASFFYLRKLIKMKNIDIVYTNVSVAFPGAIAAKSCGKKSIWHIREIIKNDKERAVISFIVNLFSDIIIANSKATALSITKNQKKCRVVYNAVETSETFVEHTDENLITIGMAGRINRWKGQTLFVDMAEQIHQKFPNTKFLIAGTAYQGEEFLEDNLKNYIAGKNLDSCVVLLGQVLDMDSFYQSLDIFVLPSTQPEPFGLVVIEAMEKKLPVVATNHGGPVEIIENGVDGFLVDFKENNEMVSVISDLVPDWKLRQKIGDNAHAKKRKVFSLEEVTVKIDKILQVI